MPEDIIMALPNINKAKVINQCHLAIEVSTDSP